MQLLSIHNCSRNDLWKTKGSSAEEPLFFQCFEQSGGHGFIVLARVADVGENLGEGLLVVDFAEVAVLLELLLLL